ncbi:dienelactone hydrolase family protein [Pelagicoccus albus]|uniref:Dienelactone hydrolase family protein n=1 Tax=Pelagicoccus albus TaxID=415222 RepID=A0A7X1BBJ4_9BACT|nr:dienelactone hydrolase family protein [Pelagicoccus albus]MBC2607935.1 dienelactone hydrolase family protein [Pelagicoccus albus]
MLRTITYSVGSITFESRCYIPPFSEKPGPALIVFPNLWGPNDYWDEMLEKYSTLGYVVMIVDMYGVDTRPETFDEAYEVIKPLKADREVTRQRATAALENLAALQEVDSSKVIATGYCFGGMCVLELARISAPVLGVVSLHGTLKSPLALGQGDTIKPSVLVLHGAEDPGIPDEEVAGFMAEMRAVDADWQLVHFGGQVHAFTDRKANRPGHAKYDALTDSRSWGMMVQFIAEKFG